MFPLRQKSKTAPEPKRYAKGFSLTELLIALVILAEIATFTIPKVLNSTQNGKRYSVAMEDLATLSQVTQGYMLSQGGCFTGNLTCSINPATGAVLDGKADFASPDDGSTSYVQLTNYLDKHLNYTKRVKDGYDYVMYQLPNGSVVQPHSISVLQENPSGSRMYGIAVFYSITTNKTIAQKQAFQFSWNGVDTDLSSATIFSDGTTLGGNNQYRAHIGASYLPGSATIFDVKEHPGDTCTAVGGTNCGL